MPKKPGQLLLQVRFFGCGVFYLRRISAAPRCPSKRFSSVQDFKHTSCFAENSRQPCLNCQYKSPRGACATIFLLKHSRAHAHTHTHNTKSWIDDDISTAFFLCLLFFFFQQDKSPSQRQICVTHAPLTQLIPLFPMGCLGGDEVYFGTLHQILIIENISEATGQHQAPDKACWIQRSCFWVFVRVFSHRKGPSLIGRT